MAFFEHADDRNAADNPAVLPTGESVVQEQGWFRQQESSHVSLSDYISQHLSAGSTQSESHSSDAGPQKQSPAPNPDTPGAFLTPFASRSDWQPTQPTGLFLNSIDGDLTAGLESYLPTPLFRLRVMKKRLHDEIQTLRGRLNKYERLPEKSPELDVRIQMLHNRLATLEDHQAQVHRELASMISMIPVLEFGLRWSNRLRAQVARFGGGMGQWLSRWFYGPAYLALQQNRQELQTLHQVFADHLHDPSATEQELSQLFNRYESTLAQVESATRQLTPAPLLQQVWQRARGLVK